MHLRGWPLLKREVNVVPFASHSPYRKYLYARARTFEVQPLGEGLCTFVSFFLYYYNYIYGPGL